MAKFTWKFSSFDHPQALPLFVDLQVTGFAGISFLTLNSVDDVHKVARALFENGTGAFQPCLTTAPPEQILQAISFIESARRQYREDEAEIVGIHLEGPFLNPEIAKGHPVDHLKKPDLELLTRYLAAGVITSVTISPEIDGALELIKFLSGIGVRVWLGYSRADTQLLKRAFDAGAIGLSHASRRELFRYALEKSDVYLQIDTGSGDRSDLILKDLFIKDPISGFQDRLIAVGDLAGVKSLRSGFERFLNLGLSRGDGVMACATVGARYLGRAELSALEFGRPAHSLLELEP